MAVSRRRPEKNVLFDGKPIAFFPIFGERLARQYRYELPPMFHPDEQRRTHIG